jgi:hypothetical protein
MSPAAAREIECAMQATIRAELARDDIALAFGYRVQSASPVLALFKRLVAERYELSSRMEVNRGCTLALTVAHIGVAAGLEVDGELIALGAGNACRSLTHCA